MSDIDTAVVDSLKVLKVLDPNRPIREADIAMSIQGSIRRAVL